MQVRVSFPVGPAAFWRRSAGLLLAGSALLANLVGCAESPSPVLQTSKIEHVAREAIRLLDQGSPREARALERDIARAVEASTREFHANLWDRQESPASHFWQRVSRAAVEATRRHRQASLAAQESWRDTSAELADEIRRVREQSGGASWSRAQASDLQFAETYYKTSLELASAGSYARATETAAKALTFTAKVEKSWDVVYERFRKQDLVRVWRGWVAESVDRSRREGTVLVVDKLKRRLEVYSGGKLVDSFRAELGAHGLKPKLYAGDMATPEGRYRVTEVRTGGATKYYKALMLNYPNEEDRARYAAARREGRVPRGRGIGSLIEIHGYGGRGEDWTEGCIALSNKDMDRLFRHVRKGMPVTIVGTR